MIRVLYVASGLDSKGGLASELPKFIANSAENVHVDVIVPHTENIDEGASRLAQRLVRCHAEIDGNTQDIAVLEGRNDAHIRTFYLDCNALRGGLHLNDDSGVAACAIFAQGVCDWLANAPAAYDVVHCEGVLTALVPVFMRTLKAGCAAIDRAKTVVFLAGIEAKASVALDWIRRLGLPQSLSTSEGLEFYGKMSLLKGAYLYADKIAFPNTCVKHRIEKNVGRDIGMEGVLFNKLDRLETIRVGLDLNACDPECDKALEANFSADDLSGKSKCRNALTKSLRLAKDRPVLVFIGALNADSGIDFVNDMLDDLMDRNVNLVIVGRGNDAYEQAVESWKQEFKGRVAWLKKPLDAKEIKRLLAAADILLLPAKHESLCRLHQIAMRLGCVPVVRRQALAANDIVRVRDVQDKISQENGFTYENDDSDDFFNAAMDALDLIDSDKWDAIRKNGMTKNPTIFDTANDCIRIYNAIH